MNRDAKLLAEAYESISNKGFTLFYKNPETREVEKWITAGTLEELLTKVNQGNIEEDPNIPIVDYDREFESVDELKEFVHNSDFYITGPGNELVCGAYLKD